MNYQFLINPFAVWSEKLSLLIGTLGFFVIVFLCYSFDLKMDGILHFGNSEKTSFAKVFLQNSVIILLAVAVLWGLAKIYNRKSRLIDIINTVLIASLPNIPTLLLINLPTFKTASERLLQNLPNQDQVPVINSDLLIVLVVTCLLLPFLVYTFVLFYNGFKTATNMKSWIQISLFFIVLFTLNVATQFFLEL